MLEKDIEKTLYSKEEIAIKTAELGKAISADYGDITPLVIGILKGAIPFMADLIREIDIHVEMDFMDVSSYGEALVSSGEVKIIKDLDTNVAGRDILIVEDIIDSGQTLRYLVDLFKYRQAKSVKIVTLLDKPEGRVVDLKPDYFGYNVPNEFVVGMGLDYKERYRNLPFVGVLKPEIYESNN
ncbi:hypoxanthine phosphoribosyltransferase [Vagococcus salmoninarum]|uniref:Hypoxanthine phosphoribosyltransferase n=1 Tax=Vagococcus salmoninarum TaxID=2739 RepID=A0A429ZCP7_9ENTE|nr:hypoxanthine phosphoribosyltransferase [Vagococcus salmoninarum]MBE9389621.1 hypoxanthine phosphoribosyltransferase [Vagococcus salmoninarum]RST91449.1 hypoxanthine phosphoribosyltransferase [Vagococcus salmoninarum]